MLNPHTIQDKIRDCFPRHITQALNQLVIFALLFPASAAAGPAINQFEMKDLESEPGYLQFQSQNALSYGLPKRRSGLNGNGDTVFDDNTVTKERYALEMQMGITKWFRSRLGLEFEKERLDEPGSFANANAFENLKLSSFSVEGVFVLVPVEKRGIGLGLLTEYDASISGPGAQFSIGPIIQAQSGPWLAIANLLVVQHFDGGSIGAPPPDRKRDFAYAAQLQYTIDPTWALALEAYGTFDRIGGSGTRDPDLAQFGDFDQHRLGPVVYYRYKPGGLRLAAAAKSAGKRGDDDEKPGAAPKDADDDDDREKSVSIGVGLLFGLNDNTPKETLKLSVEVNF